MTLLQFSVSLLELNYLSEKHIPQQHRVTMLFFIIMATYWIKLLI